MRKTPGRELPRGRGRLAPEKAPKRKNESRKAAAAVLLALAAAAGSEASAALDSGLTADEAWGCQVLLCLSDPRGPRTEAECRPPVDRLYESLRSRHPRFPKCPQAGSGNYARAVSDPFDPCSLAGLEDAPAGLVVQGVKSARGFSLAGRPVMNTAGAGEAGLRTKACAKGFEGIYRWTEGSGDAAESYSARVYRELRMMPEKTSRAIDVYRDGALAARVRY